MVFPQGEVGRIQGEWKDGFLEGKGRVEQTAGGWQEAVFRLTLHFVLFSTLSACRFGCPHGFARTFGIASYSNSNLR